MMVEQRDDRESREGREAGEPGEQGEHGRGQGGFQVHLDVFEGPFDLLLALIAKHKLDVTEVALSRVTDEFIAYINAYETAHEHEWDLEQATHFLVVAATLLDLKAARLLPSGDVEDEADLELLEARDLLFARLLQYRAYKQVAGVLSERMAEQSRRFGRTAGPDPRFADVRPDVRLGVSPERFAALAARVLAPEPEPTVPTAHLYTPLADVREQADLLVGRLRRSGRMAFGRLVTDCAGTHEVVARFLALLELYRDGAVGFDQAEPLGELYVRWTGTHESDVRVGDNYDAGFGNEPGGEQGNESGNEPSGEPDSQGQSGPATRSGGRPESWVSERGHG